MPSKVSNSLVNRLEYALIAVFRHSLRSPRKTLAFFAMLIAVLGGTSWFVKKDFSMVGQAEVVTESSRHQQQFEHYFPADPTVLLILRPPPGVSQFTAEQLCRIRKWLGSEVAALPGIRGAQTIFDLRRPVVEGRFLHYQPIFKNPCEYALAQDLDLYKDFPFTRTLFDLGLRDFAIVFRLNPNLDSTTSFRELGFSSANLGFPTSFLGEAVLTEAIDAALGQVFFVNLAMGILLLCTMRVLFGTFKAGGILLLGICFTNLIIHGGMALVGHKVDMITLALFPLLAIAALEDFIFLSFCQARNPKSWRGAFRVQILPSFVTSLSTAIGFAALGFSELHSIKVLGLWAALGAMVEWSFYFMMLPALAQIMPSLRSWTVKLPKSFPHAAPRLHRAVALAVTILTIFAALFFFKPNIQNSLEKILDDSRLTESLHYLQRSRGWETSVNLVFKPEAQASDRRNAINEIMRLPQVVGIDSFDDLQEKMQSFVPDRLKKVVALQLNYAERQFYSYSGYQTSEVYLSKSNIADVERFRVSSEQICKGFNCFLAGHSLSFAEESFLLTKTLFESLWMSLLTVGGVVLFFAVAAGERRRNLWAIVLCSFWGIAVVTLLMSLLAVPMNASTCMVGSILVGLTGDNTVQFLLYNRMRSRRRSSVQEGISQLSGPALFCALSMASLSLLLLFSPFLPMRALGSLLAVGLICGYVGDVVLMSSATT